MDKKELRAKLDLKVKGHDKAKKCLISLFDHSRIRYYQKHGLGYSDDKDGIINNKSVFLVGKSGTGKTFLVETIAKLYKMPVMILDATSFNPSGCVDGIRLQDLPKKITEFAKEFQKENSKDFFSVQGVIDQMVIFIDEFDKLGNLETDNSWYRKVQSNFLRFFENKLPGFENLSFIFAGAFMYTSIYDQHSTKNQIGFFKHNSESPEIKHDLEQMIIKAGILPEIMGRITHIAKLDSLTREDYKYILNYQLLPKKQDQLFTLTGEKLEIDPVLIDRIVDECYSSDQGVRLLSKRLDDICLDLELKHDKYNFLRV